MITMITVISLLIGIFLHGNVTPISTEFLINYLHTMGEIDMHNACTALINVKSGRSNLSCMGVLGLTVALFLHACLIMAV